jgi:hypothetical protein
MFDADVLAWHLDAGIDKRFLGDLAEIRLVVEPRAAALAAVRRSEADIAALRQSMERMRREASDSAGFADADLALHIAVANASGNPFMRSIGNVIEAALRASFLLSAPVETQDRETVLSWHQRIVDAIESGDAEAATAAMIEVIHNGLRRQEGTPASSGAATRPTASPTSRMARATRPTASPTPRMARATRPTASPIPRRARGTRPTARGTRPTARVTLTGTRARSAPRRSVWQRSAPSRERRVTGLARPAAAIALVLSSQHGGA